MYPGCTLARGVNMKLSLNRFDRNAFPREVEEELRFHIEMQALDYEREGLTPEASLAKAELRFGDFAQVRMQCVQIAFQSSARTRVMKMLFIITFLVGLLIKLMGPEFHTARIGHLLMAIGILGGLLLFATRVGATRFTPDRTSFRLGLFENSDAIPVSFDEQGRTPFERVRDDHR
jgi:hypothetical protein